MNKLNKVFKDLDLDMETQTYIVDEIMFTDVIELTGITAVDSVRRIHRLEVIDGYDAYLQPTDLA